VSSHGRQGAQASSGPFIGHYCVLFLRGFWPGPFGRIARKKRGLETTKAVAAGWTGYFSPSWILWAHTFFAALGFELRACL
jgi:hypothetical protein